MRVIFFGRKNIALKALDHLLGKNWEVLPVVPRTPEPDWAEKPSFQEGLEQRGLNYAFQEQILQALSGKSAPEGIKLFLAQPVALVISYLFPERIKSPILKLPFVAAINFHPAPLPEYGGMAGYNYAILEKRTSYGVTAHHMEETFDTGDIILSKKFKFDPESITALELEQITRPYLLELFQEVMSLIDAGEKLPRIKQGKTRYVSREEFERSKKIDLSRESPEQIERKARAFWYPPYTGAYITVQDEKFTIIPEGKLKELGILLHQKKI